MYWQEMQRVQIGIEKYHLELTDEERVELGKIDLRDTFPPGADGHAIYLANQKPILRLLRSLVERDAIPSRRSALWLDPELNPGRSKGSVKDQFARHGNVADEMFTHPHFKKYLRYFLFGADLPAGAIQEFEEQVGNPEWFSGSDIIRLTRKTRQIVRKYELDDEDEFLKLALDLGLNNYNALSVRKAAREAARRR